MNFPQDSHVSAGDTPLGYCKCDLLSSIAEINNQNSLTVVNFACSISVERFHPACVSAKMQLQKFQMRRRYKVADFEPHIKDSGGIISTIAKNVGCDWLTAKLWIDKNATLKAQAYASSTDFPILANDTGFWVHGEGFILAPKRTALLNQHPSTNLSQTEIAQAMLAFWKGVAQKHGGRVDATWIESFVILHPDGTLHCVESRRELLLTDQEFGQSHPDMPLRALYISKATGKPALNHTESEELLEMRPVMDALVALIETLPRSL